MHLADREGKVDVDLSATLDSSGVTRHRYPEIARLNEVVGAYACSVITKGLDFSMHASPYVPEFPNQDFLPSPKTRRAIGAVVNSSILTVAGVVCVNSADSLVRPVNNFVVEMFKGFYGLTRGNLM